MYSCYCGWSQEAASQQLTCYDSRQTETIECMQAFEETYYLEQDQSYLVLREKIFTLAMPSNCQNERIYANVKAKRDVSPSQLLRFQIVHLPAE